MIKSREIVQRVTQMLIDARVSRREAAQLLEVSERTLYNYLKRYSAEGPMGLIDHRTSHFRKIMPAQEVQIVMAKLDNPHRSAKWIRDRLRLAVSAEAVRQILFKHGLNRSGLGPRSKFGPHFDKWDPF